ncbi:MAG: AMP-binding protein [Bacteroidales bacterium]|nr:AMP-binding protein [Bacteroidales bacterium]MDY6406860.1 AMP-binding protein [Bacteroidales bacterium]
MTDNYLSILAETIRSNRDQPALTDFYLSEDGTAQDTSRGNHYTYGEMYAEICRVANLLTSLGLQKGDHIAICGANSAHWVIAYLAIAKMQGVSVTVMHTLMSDEIARLVDFSDAKALFTDEDIWAELKSQPIPQVGNVIGLENWQILRGENLQISNFKSPISNSDCGFPQSAPEDLAMICFTSGTSGKPKGVTHSYRSISGGVKGSINTLPSETKRNYVSILPLAHIFGLVGDIDHLINAHNIVYVRAFSPKDLLGVLFKTSPYIFVTVPKVLERLLAIRPDLLEIFRKIGIEGITCGGSSLNSNLEDVLIKNKFPLVSLYGTTEGMIFSGSKYHEYKSQSCGKVVSGMAARISPAGEILVKGENVMLGYYKDPEATAAKIDSDGWLHTGDKGHLDEDGYLYVEGRLEQDMIVLPNGENIRPDHIESLINALPKVSESIVLARDGKLVAIVVPQITNHQPPITNTDLHRMVLRTVNPSLPLFSQLYDVEITDQPLARTEKQTLKRYLYR